MSTKYQLVNDDFAFFAVNMKSREAIVRLLLAATLIGVLIAEPTMAYKMLLVVPAVYLFTSAITRWDPLYAWMAPNPIHVAIAHLPKHSNEGKLSLDIRHGHFQRAANDENRNKEEMKDSA